MQLLNTYLRMLYELHVFIFHKIIKKNLGKQKIKVFFFYKDKQERVAIPKKKVFLIFFYNTISEQESTVILDQPVINSTMGICHCDLVYHGLSYTYVSTCIFHCIFCGSL